MTLMDCLSVKEAKKTNNYSYAGRPVVFENKKRTKCTHTKFIENVHKMYTKNVYCKYNTIKV